MRMGAAVCLPMREKIMVLYLVPEIDETVLVGFIGGSLKRPFLLGSLYPGGASVVSENFDQKNLKKHLKTKGGMDLLIQEEDGKQSITLTTPKGSVLAVAMRRKAVRSLIKTERTAQHGL